MDVCHCNLVMHYFAQPSTQQHHGHHFHTHSEQCASCCLVFVLACILNGNSMPVQWTFNEHSMVIQWSFNGNSMAVQWQFNEHSMAVQWQFIEHSMAIQWTFNGNSVLNIVNPTPQVFLDAAYRGGLTVFRAEMDSWQSGAWDVRILCDSRLEKRSFTKAHIKPPETFQYTHYI